MPTTQSHRRVGQVADDVELPMLDPTEPDPHVECAEQLQAAEAQIAEQRAERKRLDAERREVQARYLALADELLAGAGARGQSPAVVWGSLWHFEGDLMLQAQQRGDVLDTLARKRIRVAARAVWERHVATEQAQAAGVGLGVGVCA